MALNARPCERITTPEVVLASNSLTIYHKHMAWEVEFYEDQHGSCPVEDFLDSLSDKHLGKMLQLIQMLEERGPSLPFPYSSQVEGKLRELRAHYGRVQYRLLYYGDAHGAFMLLHAFRKQTARLPEREKQLALQRMRDDEQRKRGGS